VKAGSLTVMLKSKIKVIGERDIHIEHDGKKLKLKNDAVIICAGGILPTAFLKNCGIDVETKYGTA
jgi:thioredoxin reductase (NADPH)